MARNDIRGVARCPQEVSEYLSTIGGLSPFGEPIWRLVMADSVIWRVAGGKIWDSSLSIAERGGFVSNDFNPEGLGLKISEAKPLRDDTGKLVEQQRYSDLDGWILQRWFPASSYDRNTWCAPENCLPDGTPKLGPFPVEGDYELIGGPVQHMPSASELREYISRYLKGLEQRVGTVEQRVAASVYRQEQSREKQEQQLETFVIEYMRDKCSYIWSSSLEAGRVRTERAEKLGIFTHVGN